MNFLVFETGFLNRNYGRKTMHCNRCFKGFLEVLKVRRLQRGAAYKVQIFAVALIAITQAQSGAALEDQGFAQVGSMRLNPTDS